MPVYKALGAGWDPDATGSIQDEAPGADYEAVLRAIREEFGARYELETGQLSEATLALAWDLERHHVLP